MASACALPPKGLEAGARRTSGHPRRVRVAGLVTPLIAGRLLAYREAAITTIARLHLVGARMIGPWRHIHLDPVFIRYTLMLLWFAHYR
jgi:hypothetical protein